MTGACVLAILISSAASVAVGTQGAPYYPPAGAWEKRSAAQMGLDPALLAEAVAWAQTRESRREMDFSDQEKIFGSLLGSVPTKRAKTNGVVIYKGYVIAEFGDTT